VREFQVVLYGSYGYTGELIAQACKHSTLTVLLAGRNEAKLRQQAATHNFPYHTAEVSDHKSLVALLQRASLLIHCAGPFQYTAHALVKACLEAGTHYTDISGEFQVFESLGHYTEEAKAKQLVIMPGVGFDVVPSDCLALHLKNRLPSATHLQLAFTMGKGGLSRGTSKTMIEGMGHGSCIRENGKLKSIALGEKIMTIDFGSFSRTTLCIPWGDISTAWRSTRIPNIEVYSGVSSSAIRGAKLSKYLGWLLRSRWVKEYLHKQVDKKPAGPTEQRRNEGRSYLWGKVWNEAGEEHTSRLETLNGYSLTAKTAVLLAEKILRSTIKGGYTTPAQYFGADLILEIETTLRTDVN
jgi:short subunit dehydrogenase-like uncharacterized protein